MVDKCSADDPCPLSGERRVVWYAVHRQTAVSFGERAGERMICNYFYTRRIRGREPMEAGTRNIVHEASVHSAQQSRKNKYSICCGVLRLRLSTPLALQCLDSTRGMLTFSMEILFFPGVVEETKTRIKAISACSPNERRQVRGERYIM